jgi:hypothetical protein
MSRPIALAVLRLIKSSYLVGACTPTPSPATSNDANGSVFSAKLVRVLAWSPLLITLHNTVANSQIGLVVMGANSVLLLQFAEPLKSWSCSVL